MAQAKKNTAYVKNTASRLALKGNVAKSSTTNRPNAAKRRSVVRKVVRSKRRYRRNPAMSGALDGLMPAVIGAIGINLFDLGVNTLAPNLSGTIRTGAKFAAGFAVKLWGRKMPLVGAYSATIGNALFLAGALDLVGSYVMPAITNAVSQAKSSVSGLLGSGDAVVVSSTPTTSTDGQVGRLLRLNNGSTVEVFRRPQQPQRNYVW